MSKRSEYIIDRVAPQSKDWDAAKRAYLTHLLSSWYGWRPDTGFIMPSDGWMAKIEARIRRAVKFTERNRP